MREDVSLWQSWCVGPMADTRSLVLGRPHTVGELHRGTGGRLPWFTVQTANPSGRWTRYRSAIMVGGLAWAE